MHKFKDSFAALLVFRSFSEDWIQEIKSEEVYLFNILKRGFFLKVKFIYNT
ncbi:MAG: hypothetical protein UR27_C0011G0031 [Candidatus Peregrinibacteria bacterium GW2011_GWA2_33_10]|nr:MAG: hypothetical protein UR27_C0011G0031 [Candidatus Peregrinibacteria bacterium GW2011_GWA2_33_10]